MNKRIIGFALGGMLLALGATVRAQQPAKVHRLGLLTPAGPQIRSAFEEELRKLGYVEGRNISIQHRYANGQVDRLPGLAAELVRHPVDLIMTRSFPAALAAKQASATIPIVASGAGDPVATGLVASMARPGGNITGVAAHETELSAKRLELLKEAFPRLDRVAVLWNSADLGMTLRFREVEGTARSLRVALQAQGVRAPPDFDDAFSAIRRHRPGALFVITDVLTRLNRKAVLDFAVESRLPAMYEGSDFVEAGGLMSYGPNTAEILRRAAHYADRILKGAKPADLPVEQPAKFEMIINLKTAKQIGVVFPPNMLARADRVIK